MVVCYSGVKIINKKINSIKLFLNEFSSSHIPRNQTGSLNYANFIYVYLLFYIVFFFILLFIYYYFNLFCFMNEQTPTSFFFLNFNK